MPELPAVKRTRFIQELGLGEYDAQVLTASRDIAEYFESVAARAGDARLSAHWVMGDLMGALKAAGKEISESPVTAENLGDLLALTAKGEISGKLAKEIFPKMFASGETGRRHHGTRRIEADQRFRRAREDHRRGSALQFPNRSNNTRAGKTTVIGYLVGQAMKATRGQANPQALNQLLKQKLDA